MSDITIEFTWSQLSLLLLLIGWPGAVFGGVAGGLLWRRHPVVGVIVGVVAGLALWVGVKILFR